MGVELSSELVVGQHRGDSRLQNLRSQLLEWIVLRCSLLYVGVL